MISTTSRRWQHKKQRERKLLVQTLESRSMLAADVFVSSDFDIINNVGPAGLSAGDIVDISSVEGAAGDTAVFGTDAFADIDAAIDAVEAGGTVNVLAGTYNTDITIDKSITLAGANAGVSAGVDAEDRSAETIINGGITVSAAGVTIDGLTIDGGVDVGGDVAGIYLAADASDVTISNNILTGDGTGRGILTTFNGGNDNLLIENNAISEWTTGIFNQTNEDVEIVGNLIEDNVAGVANDLTEDVTIEGNDFKSNDEAIGTLNSEDLKVVGNDLADNVVAIANYGGEEVKAIENFWGTVDLDEIADLVTGDVSFTDPLATSPFDIVELPDLVFSSESGATLTIDQNTGDFVFDDGDGLIVEGTGAIVKNGKIMIHTHDALGRKIDVKGSVDGDIDVDIKQLGKGIKKKSFDLTADTTDATT